MNLINKVKKVNRIAALHLQKMKHPKISLNLKPGISMGEDTSLNQSFIWEQTPQGHDYWSDVHKSLMLQEYEEKTYDGSTLRR